MDWARGIGKRHARAAERQSALTLILTRRLPLMQFISQRWSIWSHRFQPRLNLAIRPILRQIIRGEPLLPQLPPLGHDRSGALATRSFVDRFVFPQFDAGIERMFRERASENAFDQEAVSRLPKEDQGIARRKALETPLEMVFRRLSGTGELVRVNNALSSVETRTVSLPSRVREQSRRVEERADRPATRVIRQPVAPPVVAAEQVVGAFRSQPAVHTAPPGAKAMSVPAINIEQITDHVVRQLDRRVVAARERMGKI